MTIGKAREVVELYQSGFQLLHVGEKKADASKRSPRNQLEVEQHLLTMCKTILAYIDGYRTERGAPLCEDDILDGKYSCWLGFVQGCLWLMGVYTIDELREHNTK